MELLIRKAAATDLPQLALMNKELIEDEGGSNPMSIEQLQNRMSNWLAGEWKIESASRQRLWDRGVEAID